MKRKVAITASLKASTAVMLAESGHRFLHLHRPRLLSSAMIVKLARKAIWIFGTALATLAVISGAPPGNAASGPIVEPNALRLLDSAAVYLSAQNSPLRAVATEPTLAQTLPPSQEVAPKILVARIDQNCGVYHTAIQTEQPADAVRAQTNTCALFEENDPAIVKQITALPYYRNLP